MSDLHELTPRPFPTAPDDVEALLAALGRNRRTFAWKTGALEADEMRRTLGPSTLTLGGLVKHMALVEDDYFTHQLHGRDYPAVWAPMSEQDEWVWTSAADDAPDTLVVANPEGSEAFNLRRLIIDMIEEYARHTGHADLIRESIDGLVGEDAP